MAIKTAVIKHCIITDKETLEKEGFDFSVYDYMANCIFPCGSMLKRVLVIGDMCLQISVDGKKVLFFKHTDQNKGFRLEKLYEN